MNSFEAIRARIDQELSSVLNATGLTESLGGSDRSSLIDMIENSLPIQSDSLLFLDGESSEPVVVRYDIKSIISAAAGLLGGVHGDLIGAFTALSGIWGLASSRQRLTPAHGLIVRLLFQSDNFVSDIEDFENTFTFWHNQIWGRDPAVGDFSSALYSLEEKEIVAREGSGIRLNESCLITPL